MRVTTDHVATAFDAATPPALEVDPGAVVTFETTDAAFAELASGVALEAVDPWKLNVVTGPVLVRGAQPGDALRIEVLDVRIDRAWVVWLPGFGALGARTDALQVVPAPIDGDRIDLGDGLTTPLRPMIGCIGLAPAQGTASTLRPVYPTGGNLDLRELEPGAVLWLPVAVPGALLSLGDLHAAMGQGEATNVALEARGEATVRLDLEKGSKLTLPRLRIGTETICVGLGPDFPEARRSAVEQAFDLLVGEHGLSPLAAYAYASVRVDLRAAGPAGSTVEGLQAVLAAVPDPA